MNIDYPVFTLRDKLGIVALGILVFAALGAGFWLGNSKQPVAENITYAPAVVQDDGSMIAERVHDSDPPKPPHKLPKKSIEVRRGQATIQPVDPNCEPITVNTSLVQVDGGLRQIVSSPDGVVLSATDIPIKVLNISPEPPKWGVGASIQPFEQRYGVWLQRDFGRIRAGVELVQRDGGGVDPWIKLGVAF